MTLAAIFPGQGSQTIGMGADLFDRFPDWLETADRILGYSLRRLCLEDPGRELSSTTFTQPALFTVNAMAYRRHIEDGGAEPDFLAGHSLGEFNALLAAEAFDFEEGLRLVQKRGELMGAVAGGGMAAVIGLPSSRIRALLEEAALGSIDVANFNSISQTVLSGPVADLERARASIEAAGGRFVALNVRTAFHSRYMQEAARRFGEFLASRSFRPLLIPVMSNFTALPYRDDEIAHNLVKQIDHSVRWVETVQYLVDEFDAHFVDRAPAPC